ncbi:hypothetical protein ASC77_19985 [Nocardioides sp. Root1257]|uniref:hypothetical protein n=1 Tax=unclassified Nocardioides TaxID=2615069 RepID=UPI0007006DAA|nr:MULTISPECIES: hypothetical protein [unclassified Nocardioides]KQW45064.1 hypothetical protein ASC77_19985 [Nocardioides sp. Root1257]KRC45932.1 hypothetical protein ASE24_15235 [Nocardioides sp. Root224]
MDVFDASDFDFLMPRRIRKLLALALMLGIVVVSPVRDWFVGQVERHAEHLTREIQDLVIPELPPVTPTPPESQPVDRAPAGGTGDR